MADFILKHPAEMHVSGLPTKSWLAIAVAWEYEPGFGTIAPPPKRAQQSTWRGAETWKMAQSQWFLFFDNIEGELPSIPAERTQAWQNALKRHARAYRRTQKRIRDCESSEDSNS